MQESIFNKLFQEFNYLLKRLLSTVGTGGPGGEGGSARVFVYNDPTPASIVRFRNLTVGTSATSQPTIAANPTRLAVELTNLSSATVYFGQSKSEVDLAIAYPLLPGDTKIIDRWKGDLYVGASANGALVGIIEYYQ